MTRRGLLLFLGAVAAGLLVVVVVFVRAHQTASSDAKLCRKVDRLDAALLAFVSKSKPLRPGQYGYAYWLSHHKTERIGAPGGPPPQALVKLLKSAACDPANLPSQGGKP